MEVAGFELVISGCDTFLVVMVEGFGTERGNTLFLAAMGMSVSPNPLFGVTPFLS